MEAVSPIIPSVAGGASLRVPMSEAAYRRVGERRHTEYADGLLVVNPPTRRHERAVRRLAALLADHLPATHELFTGWGWRLPNGSERNPDLMAVDRGAEDDRILVGPPPLLVVEVTSPSTADIDLGAKVHEYGSGGASWYWVVQPGCVLVHQNVDGQMIEVQRLTSAGTTTGPWSVHLDPADL